MTMPSTRFLIVEDEALLAMDLAATVEERGHSVVGEAASLVEVTALPVDLVADCALVDVHLLHGSSGIDAACFLRQTWPKIRIIFVTANPTRIPADFEGAVGIVQKPFSRPTLLAAIDFLVMPPEPDRAGTGMPPNILPIPARPEA